MENQADRIEFSCACGKSFRARLDQRGKSYKCPGCGGAVIVPNTSTIAPTPSPVPPPPVPAAAVVHTAQAGRPPARKLWLPLQTPKIPSTVGQLLGYLTASWFIFGVVLLLPAFFSRYLGIAGLVAFTMVSAAAVQQCWRLLSARQNVLEKKNVPLLWGFVRLIAWDPVEGVLILRNKVVTFCDDNLEDGSGGVRFLYPVLGEELALRVPLEVQTLSFRDENVLTREYLSVTVRGTMKWRVVDIRKFYLFVSRELRSTTNHNDRESVSPPTREVTSGDTSAEAAIRQLHRAAIAWLQVLVEEETRALVSKSRTGLLIADRLTQELFSNAYEHDHVPSASANGPGAAAVVEQRGAADGLAGAIYDSVSRRLSSYGIAVEDVSLQEIKLPEEIMRECIDACKAYYYPTLAKRRASFAGEKLQAQADALGREAIATREIVGAAPAFTLPDFLSNFLQQRLSAAKSAAAPGLDAAAVAGAMAAITQASPGRNGEHAPALDSSAATAQQSSSG